MYWQEYLRALFNQSEDCPATLSVNHHTVSAARIFIFAPLRCFIYGPLPKPPVQQDKFLFCAMGREPNQPGPRCRRNLKRESGTISHTNLFLYAWNHDSMSAKQINELLQVKMLDIHVTNNSGDLSIVQAAITKYSSLIFQTNEPKEKPNPNGSHRGYTETSMKESQADLQPSQSHSLS